ncbi:MAG: HEPN domain-containing protein [Methanobacteriaceae archaeon]|nr:HEPN domain-containing protein [Methanobacteriaceae archaeon]
MEKGLKALFILKNRTSSGKTHSLIYLATETDTPLKFHSFLRRLAPEFVTTRYILMQVMGHLLKSMMKKSPLKLL